MIELPMDLAPGCFGSALTYREGTTECSTCQFNSACKPVSETRLVELRARLGLKQKLPMDGANRPALFEGRVLTMAVDRETALLIKRIDDAKIEVRAALSRGVNPFLKHPQFKSLAYVCQLLLRKPGGFNQDALRRSFMVQMKCEEKIAQSLVSKAVRFFVAIGAAEDADGMIKPRRSPAQ